MHTIVLDITDNNVSYHLVLDRRLNFIKGDSGSGKTTIRDLLNDSVNDNSISVSCNYKYLPVTNLSWERDVQTSKHTLLIFDDMEIISTSYFASLVKKYAIDNDLCFLIMSREDSDDLGSVGRLSFSTNNIFKLVEKEGVYVLDSYYKFPRYNGSFDLCITEDSKAGHTFFKNLITCCDVVPTTEGKASIAPDILKYIKENKYKSILVILDTSAFGCHIEELYSKLKEKECNVSFISTLECFEELLVRTNLLNKLDIIKKQLSDLPRYANKYVSWENYFENLIEVATEDKLYRHTHRSNLKDCYYVDCSECNSYKRDKCDGVLNGSKFKELLSGTKFEFLLDYMN